ncbi:hypothetical protein [Sphingopyxis sp.]|jgi:hypothetical protein|uniref:hypothetical protein n=1 Tax=Sphingopyxis sp. TaxID=1908224 RepID=UPI002E035032|nr:hypothetical protein [Sphingopyxis sp.]
MFIRFVIADLDADSGRRQGLFQAGEALVQSGRMNPFDQEHLEQTYRWFRLHLPVPTRFAVSRRPHAKAQALSWFRDSAIEHIDRIREYQRILDAYDIPVEMLRTTRPGYIVFEDEYQIAAYPFADTPC